MGFQLKTCSIFDIEAEAYVNTINTSGAMGAGIALEFKKRYPEMFESYKEACLLKEINPGDCWTYKQGNSYLLNLAVKRNWKEWATQEWIEQSLKSFKLEVLERNIKNVAMPLLGGKNGRRGPWGPVQGFTQPLMPDELKKWLVKEMTKFSENFDLEITLCIPDGKPIISPSDKIKELANQFFSLK
jgi:hypothetical protein